MKKIYSIITILIILFTSISCHLGRVLVNDNVKFSSDYKTITYNDVSYESFNLFDLNRTITDNDIIIYKQEPAPFMAFHKVIYKSSFSNSPFIYECTSPSSKHVRSFYLDEKVDIKNLVFIDSIYESDVLLFNELIDCGKEDSVNLELLEDCKLDIEYEKISKLKFYLKDDPLLYYTFGEVYFYNNDYYINEGLDYYKLSEKLVNIISYIK